MKDNGFLILIALLAGLGIGFLFGRDYEKNHGYCEIRGPNWMIRYHEENNHRP